MAAATNSDIKPVKIALNLIKADHALQPRVEMDDEHWNRMARAYVEGEDIPPPIHLFYDGKLYWLVDGFHRFKAMWSLRNMGTKFTHIRAIVHQGTKQEAIVYAAQANLDNRSKPMSDADRKKALWMLMGSPDWRSKSSRTLAKTVGLGVSTGRRYWLEYFKANGLEVPEFTETSLGKAFPTTIGGSKTGRPPKINATQKGSFMVNFNGKRTYLGTDHDLAKAKVQDYMKQREAQKRSYSRCSTIMDAFTAHLVLSEPLPLGTMSSTSLYGRVVSGIPVTWGEFTAPGNEVSSIGRAICCREAVGSVRVVVLCNPEDGEERVLELGRKAGIEFMTIEDFVASIKTQTEGTE